MTDWDARWLNLAAEIAKWSKDPATKVGCVIVGSARQILTAGFNGFPRGVDDDVSERYSREMRDGRREKLRWTEHAERNAIYNAARHGISLHGGVIYSSFHPCADCTRAIIQAGLAELVTVEPARNLEFWKTDFEVSRIMLDEAEVKVRLVPGR